MANFSKMYEQYVEQVYCFLRELSGDDSFAEELTRKTFYQAFLHVDSFENRSSVFEWLCEMGENVYLREMKRRKKFAPESNHQVSAFEKEVRGSKHPISAFEEEVFGSKHPIPVFKGEASESDVDAAERKRRIRQGLRRIRRRWICSVIAAAAAILLVFMGAALIVGVLCAGGVFGI